MIALRVFGGKIDPNVSRFLRGKGKTRGSGGIRPDSLHPILDVNVLARLCIPPFVKSAEFCAEGYGIIIIVCGSQPELDFFACIEDVGIGKHTDLVFATRNQDFAPARYFTAAFIGDLRFNIVVTIVFFPRSVKTDRRLAIGIELNRSAGDDFAVSVIPVVIAIVFISRIVVCIIGVPAVVSGIENRIVDFLIGHG